MALLHIGLGLALQALQYVWPADTWVFRCSEERDGELSENILALCRVSLSDDYFSCVDKLSHQTPKLWSVEQRCYVGMFHPLTSGST